MKRWTLFFLMGGLFACSQPPSPITLTLLPDPPSGGILFSHDGRLRCGVGETLCRAQYPKESRIVLRAQAEAFYYFSGWQGVCEGFGECTLTLEEDTQVRGKFTPFQGGFQVRPPSLVVVPLGGKVEVGVDLIPEGGLDVPPWAYQVGLESVLVGEAPDQVRVRYLSQVSGPTRLVLHLEGPDPAYLGGSYAQETAVLRVALPGLEQRAEFTLVVARCGGGCP